MSNSIDQILKLSHMINGLECVDLAPLIEKGIPRWPTHPHPVIDPTVTHEHDGYFCQTINIPEHTASHVDSPSHILADKMNETIDTFPANVLFGPAVKYDFTSMNPEPGKLFTADDLIEIEKATGIEAKEGYVALLHFGWMKYWVTTSDWKYYATNAPGLDESAVKLLAERKVRAVGTDTIACDQAIVDGKAIYSYGHEIYWLPNKILMMESLANLDLLPPISYFIALPLKIKNGSGSPIRPIALFPKE